MLAHCRIASLYILLVLGSHYVGAVAKHPGGARRTADKGKHKKDGENEAPRNSKARTMLYSSAIICVLLFGYLWNYIVWENAQLVISLAAALLHIPAQFLPFLARWIPWLAQGHIGCSYGLPWEWHFTYAVILALASPILLSNTPKLWETGRVPIIELGGTPFRIYIYGTTLLNAFDLYSDCAAVSLAIACGWNKAWLMVVVLVTSYVGQVLAALYMGGPLGLIGLVLGANSEASIFGTAPHHVEGAERDHAVIVVVRLVTEIVPQSALSVLFALEVKPNQFIWVSVGFSLAMGAKSFAKGIQYFHRPARSHDLQSCPHE